MHVCHWGMLPYLKEWKIHFDHLEYTLHCYHYFTLVQDNFEAKFKEAPFQKYQQGGHFSSFVRLRILFITSIIYMIALQAI